jgi:hypothetical protein
MGTPQFQKAEYAGTRGGDRCKICGAALGAEYWRVGTSMACAACAEKAKSALPQDSHAAFTRGILYGIGGAIVGLVIYATFTILTGIILGYVSLAVGWIVGKSIRMGSNNMAGRRYQIAAVILTYAAVSLAAVPIGISYIVKHERALAAQQAASKRSGEYSVTVTPEDSGQQVPNPGATPARPAPPHVDLGPVIARLAFLGLASPFLELGQNPVTGLIGLFILAIGLRIAWQITGAPSLPPVGGPFRNTSASAAPAPAAPPPPAAPRPLG